MECCIIRDSKGKEFIVGNVCVGKTGDRGLVNPVKREVNRRRTEARHAREHAVISAARARLEDPKVRECLEKQPHPLAARPTFDCVGNPTNGRTFFTDKTRLDWADWMMAHSGNAGRLRVAAYLNQITAQGQTS
jgi:hypothetical protein